MKVSIWFSSMLKICWTVSRVLAERRKSAVNQNKMIKPVK